jgi:hypothetical protein
LPWWAAIAFAFDGRRWCVSILRNGAQGPFTPDDARDLASAAAGLGRVVSLAGKLTLSHARSAVEAPERIGRAALVLDRRGRCIIMNGLAQSLTGSDLRLTDNRLHALDRDSDHRLQRLIDCAVAAGTGAFAPSLVFVKRREGRPYMVEALPATGPMRDVFQRIAALLVVTDLNARPPPPDGLIRDAFGLTPAEARLAATLGAGEDLHRAAEIHSMAYETARQHLKAIFSKTSGDSPSWWRCCRDCRREEARSRDSGGSPRPLPRRSASEVRPVDASPFRHVGRILGFCYRLRDKHAASRARL